MQPTSVSGRSLQERLLETLQGYIDAQNRGDAPGVAQHMHSASPFFDATRQALAQLFVNYTLACTLVDAELIGADACYGYARVRQKTVKVHGPSFDNNITDSLMVFRQERGEWKIWAQAMLAVEPLQ